MSAMLALFYLRSRKVGTEFSQETAASDSDQSSLLLQTSLSSFTFKFVSFLSSPWLQLSETIDHFNSWHFKSRTREQPELERPRAA